MTQKLSDINLGDKITVKSWWGIQEMTAIGQGAYPYECIAKDKHPDAMIFENDHNGWLGSYDLKQEANDYGQFEANY